MLLLNVPPNRDGLFAEPDVRRLRELGAVLREVFGTDLARGGQVIGAPMRTDREFDARNVTDGDPRTFWAAADGATNAVLTIELKTPRTFNVASLREPFWLGERAQRYHVEAESLTQPGEWRTLARGSVIGARTLPVFPDTTARRVRLAIEQARGVPALSEFGLHHLTRIQRKASLALSAHRSATASNVHPQGTSFGADKAVDDDPDTRWATADGTTECWLEVDLEKAERFDHVAISELAPRIKKFAIEYKTETAAPWKVALEGGEAGRNYEHSFPTVTGRFVRLHILDANEAPSVWEFGVFAPGGGAAVGE